MDRRRFLAITASALLAGCGQESDPSTTERTPRPPTRDTGRSPPGTTTARARPTTTSSASTPEQTALSPRTASAESSPPGTPASETTASGTPTPGTPPPITFSGRGSAVRETIDVVGGVVIVEAAYEGSGEFALTFRPSDGGRARRVLDTSGPYDDAVANLLDAGTYSLSVIAEKTYWEVAIRQPRPASGRSLPMYLDQTGPGVFGPYEFEDETATAAASYFGDETFLVEVLEPTGEFPTIVYSHEGSLTREATFEPPDVGFVEVSVEGDWTLGIWHE